MNRYVWASLLLMTMGAATRADTYCVATDGSDKNPGTEAKPLRTIQKAASLARAGDTILVRGGVYHEAVVLRFSGQQSNPIVLKNYAGERPVIQPGEPGKQPPGHSLLLQAEEGYQRPIGWITIEGLEMRYGHDGVKFYNAHDIIIRSCHIHENWNQGILGNGNRVLIDRNIIAGNGTNQNVQQNLLHGIYATGTAFTIMNNLIYSNTAYGIQVAAYDYKEDSMAGQEYSEAKNWLIANNTIALNKNRAGIVIWQDGVENCVVQNNILYKNGGVNGILFYSQKGRRHPVRNNIFYPPGENLVSSEEDAYESTDNQQVDPRFADADSFDFRLKSVSPAINAGSSDRAPDTDFEGKRRPKGDKVDLGAYEFSPTAGPLRVHPTNPRYFTDDSGQAIYLTGSHAWTNLQDVSGYKDLTNLAELGGFKGHLEWLHSYNHNFIRLWGWEGGAWWWQGGQNDEYYVPIAYARAGPGTAWDGKPKFDLNQFNPEYFARLRSRVIAARNRGIYVSVMLFQGWSIYSHGYGNPWPLHPFKKANNINSIDADTNADGEGKEVHTLQVPDVTKLQEAYVRKVIDTVNDLDNVLYEITNETAIFSKDWQYHMIRYIKEYEASKPKQHPVGITAFDSGRAGSMEALFASPADWLSPQNDGTSGDYMHDPPAADGRKVIISDTDHLWGVGGDHSWVWKSFTRGHNPIYMDPLDRPDWVRSSEAQMQGARKAMGDTRRFAERMNLTAMTPHNELSSTGYCIAEPGREYLVYQPKAGGTFTVELNAGKYKYEWFNPVKGECGETGNVNTSGGAQQFKAPFESDAALHLRIQKPVPERKAVSEGPYPPSPVIAEIVLDWSTHQRHAQGSDNFQLTWANDDHQYGAWGDGGGFGGTNSDGRVGLGFARIEGDWDSYRGYNVWGGMDAENPTQFAGKSWGTICVGGALYSWIVPDVPDTGGLRDHYRYIELARSTNHGASWIKAPWRWRSEDNLIVPTFLVYGKNNAGARDDYVYSYFIRPQYLGVRERGDNGFGLQVHKPGALFLARVPQDRIFAGRDAYEWFTGMDDGKPTWGPLSEKRPVFENPDGSGWCISASYNPGLRRYLLATEHTVSHSNMMCLFDAPEPWGPWTTVKYWTTEDRFGKSRVGSTPDWADNVFFFSFAPKWFSADGRNFTLVFTGGGGGKDNDSMNTVRGTFSLLNPSVH